jgi:dihydrofolate reductase/DNA-binding NarL/FixJ family response regulator
MSAPPVLRVLIVDRHEVSRAAIRALLRTEGLEVVADVATAAEGLALAAELKPDIAIVDIDRAAAQKLATAGVLARLAARAVLTSSTPPQTDPNGYTFIPKSEICARVLRQALAHEFGVERSELVGSLERAYAGRSPTHPSIPADRSNETETIMRTLVSGLFITLDGVVEDPHSWNPPYYDDEMTEAVQSALKASDTHLYGRRSYDMFRSVFTGPRSERIGHAPIMNDTPKVLVSTNIADTGWGHTTVISRDVAARIGELKQRPGGTINVQASPTLVRFLLDEGLLDELHLLIHPVIVGSGQRLFDGVSAPASFVVIEATRFTSGVLSLRLAPRSTVDADARGRSVSGAALA